MQRLKVWLVYQEFQSDTPDIVGLFQSRGEAERAAEESRRSAREDYDWVVYGDQDERGHEIAEWHVDVHVEEHDIQPPGSPPVRGGIRPKYNHLHMIAFSVDSDDRDGGSAEEIMWALRQRVDELEQTGEILEAVGVPDETIDNETGLEVEVQ